jgi:hypothetical protein
VNPALAIGFVLELLDFQHRSRITTAVTVHGKPPGQLGESSEQLDDKEGSRRPSTPPETIGRVSGLGFEWLVFEPGALFRGEAADVLSSEVLY